MEQNKTLNYNRVGKLLWLCCNFRWNKTKLLVFLVLFVILSLALSILSVSSLSSTTDLLVLMNIKKKKKKLVHFRVDALAELNADYTHSALYERYSLVSQRHSERNSVWRRREVTMLQDKRYCIVYLFGYYCCQLIAILGAMIRI